MKYGSSQHTSRERGVNREDASFEVNLHLKRNGEDGKSVILQFFSSEQCEKGRSKRNQNQLQFCSCLSAYDLLHMVSKGRMKMLKATLQVRADKGGLMALTD